MNHNATLITDVLKHWMRTKAHEMESIDCPFVCANVVGHKFRCKTKRLIIDRLNHNDDKYFSAAVIII